MIKKKKFGGSVSPNGKAFDIDNLCVIIGIMLSIII